jgi:hypothetical protein
MSKDFLTIYSGNSSNITSNSQVRYDINDTSANRIKIQVFDKNASISGIKFELQSNNSSTQKTAGSSTSDSSGTFGSHLPPNTTIVPSKSLLLAKQDWQTETFYLPDNVSTFILLISNEAHRGLATERISPKNGMYLPRYLFIANHTNLILLNNDNNYCHMTWLTPFGSTTSSVSRTFIDHGGATKPIKLNSIGPYTVSDPSEPVM